MREKKPILRMSKVQYDDLFLLLQKNTIDMHFSHSFEIIFVQEFAFVNVPFQ